MESNMSDMRFNPNLIQRVNRAKQPRANRDGVDREFEYDYMGSAEFECGALFHSLQYLRDQQNISATLEILDHTLYYFGPDSCLKEVRAFLSNELADEYPPRSDYCLQERTDLWASLNFDRLEERRKQYYRPFDGWWCVTHNFNNRQDRPIWLVFRKEGDRDLWARLTKEK